MTPPRVLLVEIGTPAELPVVTPPAPRPPSSWTPNPRPSPGLPPPTGLAVASIADAAVLSWTRSTASGAATVIESAPDNAGVPGVWREVDRTGAESYTLPLPGGARWVRVRAELNGRTSVATNAVLAEPVPVGDVSEFERELRDLQERVDIVAAQAAAEAVALNQRADALRADLDTTIAEVSTLASTTDELGTELTRVESQSIERDTATTATLALLGAKNSAGTAFLLDQSRVQVAPGETLAQWRSSIQGSFQSQSSRIDDEVQARQTADAAHTAAIQAAQSTANNAATKAELTSAQNTLAAADQALSERQDLTIARLGAVEGVINPSFEQDDGWSLAPNAVMQARPESRSGARLLRFNPGSNGGVGSINAARVRVDADQRVRVSIWARSITVGGAGPNSGSTLLLRVNGYDQHGNYVPGSLQTAAVKAANELTFDWEEVSGEVLAPAGVFAVALQIRVDGLTAGSVFVDDAFLDAESRAARALSQSLSTVRNTVDQQGDTLTAHALLLDLQQTEIEAKAATTYVQAVEGTANAAAGQASSNLAAINGLTATAADHTAQITQAMEVSAQAAAGNSVLNPGFEEASGWQLGGGAYVQGGDVRSGVMALHFSSNGFANNNLRVPAPQSRRVRAGGWFQYAGSRPDSWARVTVRCYSATGGHLRDMDVIHISQNAISVNYQLFSGEVILADDVATIALRIYTSGSHTTGLWTCDDVFMEPVGSTLADVLTSYTLAMNAAGKFAGVKYLNDGSVSNAVFLFDHFDFETADGSFRISDGRTITRSNGFMRVEGKPFGQNNEMVVWYGPEQSNLANCRRNNAISYETNTGLHYAKGAMFAGTITAGGQTLAENATVYTTGPFGTNGGPIVVNASFSHARRQLAGMNAQGKNTITAGSGSTSATLQLWRSIGGAAWQMVASTSITGTFVINSDPAPDVQDQAFWDLVGAINYTDNAGGTATRNYELRVSNIQFRSVSISGPAPVPTPTNSRALGVLTAE